MSAYRFPRLFVKGKKSKEYAKVVGDEVVFGEEGEYGKVPYEIPLEELVDLLEERAKVSFIIHIPNENKAILVPEGTRVKILRAVHTAVRGLPKEGEVLEEGDVYATGLTGKGEIRKLRTLEKGLVAMVHWEPYGGKDVYHLLLVPEDQVKVLRARS